MNAVPLPEPVGHHHRGSGTFAFDQCVGRKCPAVDDQVEIRCGQTGLRHCLLDAAEYAFLRRCRNSRYFACKQIALMRGLTRNNTVIEEDAEPGREQDLSGEAVQYPDQHE